jgi:hypothetical protein
MYLGINCRKNIRSYFINHRGFDVHAYVTILAFEMVVESKWQLVIKATK